MGFNPRFSYARLHWERFGIRSCADDGADSRYDFELLFPGLGPAGQRSAIQATKLDKRVTVIEHKSVVGGVYLNTGGIPSKILREGILQFSGYPERNIYGEFYSVKQDIKMSDLLFRADYVIRTEIDVFSSHLQRNGIHILSARASSVDDHTLRIDLRMGVAAAS